MNVNFVFHLLSKYFLLAIRHLAEIMKWKVGGEPKRNFKNNCISFKGMSPRRHDMEHRD